MKGSFTQWRYRLLALFLPAVMLVLGHAPARAGIRAVEVADGDLVDDFDPVTDPTNPEGDPLDTNDFGGGDNPGIRTYQAGDGYASWFFLSRPVSGKQVILVPVSRGGLVTFRLLVIEPPVAVSEE